MSNDLFLTIIFLLVWAVAGVAFVGGVKEDPEGFFKTLLYIILAGPLAWVLAIYFFPIPSKRRRALK